MSLPSGRLRALAAELRGSRAEAGVSRRLERASKSGAPVVVGPWHSEIGFELLYWIPFLNRVLAEYSIAREQVTAVSRGGADPWYGHIAATYVDVLDHFSVEELRELHAAKVTALAGQKQVRALAEDEQLLARVLGSAEEAVIVHPASMYRLLHGYWAGRWPVRAIERRLRFAPLDAGPGPPLPDLPDRYIAVKAYFSDCFPDTEANRDFLARLIGSLAASWDVVLLDTGLAIDDHDDAPFDEVGRVISARGWMAPRDNLAVQTRIIAGAAAAIGTYGGFSYLGPFLGVPSFGFYSEDNFDHGHLDVMDRACRGLAAHAIAAPFAAMPTGAADLMIRLTGLTGAST